MRPLHDLLPPTAADTILEAVKRAAKACPGNPEAGYDHVYPSMEALNATDTIVRDTVQRLLEDAAGFCRECDECDAGIWCREVVIPDE